MSQKRAKSSFKFLGGLTSWAPNLLLDGIPDKTGSEEHQETVRNYPASPTHMVSGHTNTRAFSDSSQIHQVVCSKPWLELEAPAFWGDLGIGYVLKLAMCRSTIHIQVDVVPIFGNTFRPRLCTKGLIDDSRQEFLGSTKQAEKGHLQLQGTSSACLGFQTFPSTGCLPPSLPPSPRDPKHLHQGISRGWPKPLKPRIL